MKKTLKYNDRIKMHSTTDVSLDGKTGTLIGTCAIFPGNTFWIVELDEPQPDRRAIVLTDACIEHFGVEESKGWVCSNCGIDRSKEACPNGYHAALTGQCPMIGVAQ